MLLMVAAGNTFGQSWCPPGAEWHVTRSGFMMQGYAHYVYEGDTFIYGRNAQKISQSGYEYVTYPQPQEYIISGLGYTSLEDDVLLVPISIPFTQTWTWDTLIWFGANIGDRWYSPGDDGTWCGPPPIGMFEVTDTSITIIEGITLRTLRIAGVDSEGNATGPEYIFTERLGLHYSFNDLMAPCFADGPGWGTIRCYSDNEISYVSPFWNGPCNMGLSVDEHNSSEVFLHPNPGIDHFTLELPPGPHDLLIYDPQGKLVMKVKHPGDRTSIETSTLPSGIYQIIVIDRFGKSNGIRWVKQ